MTNPPIPPARQTAWENLKNCQRQLDADGVEVGVSRQALDEVLAFLQSAPEVPETIYRAVERVLDENSAWIARPNHEVTLRVALAAELVRAYDSAQSAPERGGDE